MQQRNWWEDDPVVQPAPTAQRSGSPRRPLVIEGPPREPTPDTPTQEALNRANIERIRNDPSNSPAAQAKMAAEAALAAQQAQQGGGPNAINQRDEAGIRRANMEAVTRAAQRAMGLYRSDFENNGVLGSLGEFVPNRFSPTNQAFDSAAAGLSNAAQAMTKIPGMGSQSDFEFAQFIAGQQPQHFEFDKTNEQKFWNIRNRIDTMRAGLGMEPANWGEAAPAPEMGGPRQTIDQSTRLRATPEAAGQPQMQLSRGTRDVENPVKKALALRMGLMITQGKSGQEIIDFANKAGIPPPANLSELLTWRRSREGQEWARKNPSKPVRPRSDYYMDTIQLSPEASLLNNAAQSAGGAYAISAGEAITGNRLDDIAGHFGGNQAAEQVRLGEEAIRGQHPYASLAGDITGQAMTEATLGRIPGLGRLAGTKWGRRGLDALYGGYAGSGQEEGDALGGALLGGVANAAGGMAGRGGQRALGSAFRGVKDEGVRYLADRGIPLTLGQMARSSEGVIPRFIASTEDRLAGLPVTGDIIGAARRRGSVGFNEAAFDEGLAPIGGKNAGRTAEVASENARDLGGQAYRDALGGVRVRQDKRYKADLLAAERFGNRNPLHSPAFRSIVDDEIKPLFDANGNLSGENLQAAIRILRGHKATFASLPLGNQMGNALDKVEDALTGMVRRQAPKVMPAFEAANRAYGNRRILSAAVLAAKNGPNPGIFTPAQLNQAAVANTKKFGGPDLAASTQRPFFDLGRYGQEILPNTVPDSGTSGRALILPTLGAIAGAGGGALSNSDDHFQGGQSGAETGLGIGALLAAPYSKAGQRVLRSLLLGKRGPTAERVAEAIRKYPWLGGYLGSGAARDVALYPELPE